MFIRITAVCFAFAVAGLAIYAVADKPKFVPEDEVRRLGYEATENGFSVFGGPMVITNDADLERFAKFLKDADPRAWNGSKLAVLNAIRDEAPKFDTHNVVLFPHPEGSGSIRVTVHKPVRNEKGDVVIRIQRDVPEIGTADMAYYLSVYVVDKKIPAINFEIDGDTFRKKRTAVVKNKSTFGKE